MENKLIEFWDGETNLLPQNDSEKAIYCKKGRFFVTIDFPNESIYYCPEDGQLIQLGGGVGKRTVEGGEIFNDYANNKATNQFATAFGGPVYFQANTDENDNIIYNETLFSNEADLVATNEASGFASFAAGGGCKAIGRYSAAFGRAYVDDNGVLKENIAYGKGSFVVGHGNRAGDTIEDGWFAFVSGWNNKVTGNGGFATGRNNTVTGAHSSVVGQANQVNGNYSHVGGYGNIVKGPHCGVYGKGNNISAEYAFAAGRENIITGLYGQAFGRYNTITGQYATAFGDTCTAQGNISAAFGHNTKALGLRSFTAGYYTVANKQHQAVFGEYNDNKDLTLFEIGNGTKESNRSNVFEVYKDGRIATGTNTQVGNKAFKILSIEPINETGDYTIVINGNVLEDINPYAVDDIVQILCKTDVNNSYKIASISADGTTIIITKADNRHVQPPKLHTNDTENKRNWLYVAGKNGGEYCPALIAATALGIDSVATGYGATAMGAQTQATGYYATTFGRKTKAAYAGVAGGEGSEAGNYGVALGNYVKALGDGSVATGTNTYARAASSRAGGRESQALSEFTVAEGLGVIAGLKQGQVVHGSYNLRNDNDLFIIGNGTDEENRSNAMQVTTDGKILLENGTKTVATTEEVNSVQETLQFAINSKPIYRYENKGVIVDDISGSVASANYSLALNQKTQAIGISSLATGANTRATGQYSFTAGIGTVARQHGQFVIGSYNDQKAWEADGSVDGTNRIFIVGNGTDASNKSNAFEVRKDGTAWLQTQGELDNSVVIKSYVDTEITKAKTELLLTDNTTGVNYKIYITNGKLQMEVAE